MQAKFPSGRLLYLVAQHVAGFPVMVRLAELMGGELSKETGVAKGRRISVELVGQFVEPYHDHQGSSSMVACRRGEKAGT
jgi:hypothetical protein